MTAENCLRSKSCYTSAPKTEKACSPSKRARSLGWIRTLACGAESHSGSGVVSRRSRVQIPPGPPIPRATVFTLSLLVNATWFGLARLSYFMSEIFRRV